MDDTPATPTPATSEVDSDLPESPAPAPVSLLELPIAPNITGPPPPPFTVREPDPFVRVEPATWHNWLTRAHTNWCAAKEASEAQHADWATSRDAHQASVDAWHALDLAMRRAMIDANQAMWQHTRDHTLVVAVTHNKGGVGKTPTATNLAARAAQGTNLPVILYDGNPDLGGAALRSGIDPEQTLTLSQYYEKHEQLTFQELCGLMPPTRHGVLVVAADPDEIARKITADQTRQMLESLKKHARIVIIDLGTGVSSPVNEVAHKMADVFVYPMLTLSGVHTTAGAVDGRNSTQKRLVTQSLNDPEDEYNLVALKAEFGLTLAIGLNTADEIPAFQQAIGVDNRMLVIPFDPASNRTMPVWLPHHEGELLPTEGRVSARTALAWGKAVIALFEQASNIRMLSQERIAKAQAGSNGGPAGQHTTSPHPLPDTPAVEHAS